MKKVKIKVTKGKGGTKLVEAGVRVTPTEGKPRKIAKEIYRSRAQLNVYLWNEQGQERSKYRSS